MPRTAVVMLVVVWLAAGAATAQAGDAVRLKDVARVAGLNSHSLTGYGLVVGLANSGDTSSALSSQMLGNMLRRLGLEPDPSTLGRMKSRNVAVVAVTAELPAYARSGDRLDLRVSSLGDARSLNGGTLLLSLLRGPDGQVWASAQGAVAEQRERGARGTERDPVVGAIPGGGTVSRNLDVSALDRARVQWVLHQPDLATACQVAGAINARFGPRARATGPQSVEVDMAGEADPVGTLARMSEVPVRPERSARVVLDRTTGSVVASEEVRLTPAVVTHRGITVEITARGASVPEVVAFIQKAGGSPQDVIAVLQALHEAGSLSGELIVR